MSFFRWVGLVTDRDLWEALPIHRPRNSGPPLDGEHYREMANGLRELARQCRFPGARKELLQLAARYDRRAEYFDARAQ
jgi:hypothetical protein